MTQVTRERIVEAAVRALARNGYAATTVKDIAADAGIAPGLVHYYFKAKDELVLAAVTHACAHLRPATSGDPIATALAGFELAKNPPEQSRFFWRLFMEMLGLAQHNEAVRAALVRFVQDDRGFTEDAARAVLAQRADRSVTEAPAIAAAVWGAVLGIQIQRALDPAFDAAAAIDALTEMALR
jgi:AcrR family transcriptional regulator